MRTFVVAGLDLTTCCGGVMASPLHQAVVSNNEALVQLVLDKGADVNMPGSVSLDGVLQLYDSPLIMAVERSSTAMIKLLLDHGACVDTLSPKTGWSALHEACLGYKLETLQLLLSKGAQINLRSASYSGARSSLQGWTALHIVCDVELRPFHRDVPSVLRTLLNAGADVNATISGDLTPLIAAASHGELEEAKILLDYGANTEYRSTTYGSAFAAATPSIREALGSEIRSRALRGQNNYLRPAPRPMIIRPRVPSRIAAPVQPRSRRRELPLQHRYPPKARRALLDEEEYADALTDSNLKLWNTLETPDDDLRDHKPGSEIGSGDESEWSNAVNVHVHISSEP